MAIDLQSREEGCESYLLLLVSALENLAGLPNREAALRALPALLHRHGEDWVGVWAAMSGWLEPTGFAPDHHPSVEICSLAQEALREGKPVALGEGPGHGALGPGKLALPLMEGEQVVAVLTFERARGFSTAEREGLSRFSRMVGHVLTTLSERAEAALLTELTQVMGLASTLAGALEQALDLLAFSLGCSSGSVLCHAHGRFEPLAYRGEQANIDGRALWRVYLSATPLFSDGEVDDGEVDDGEALAIQPVEENGRARHLLVLRGRRAKLWSERERRLLATAVRTLRPVMAQFEAAERLSSLMELERQLLYEPQARMYGRLLETAVRLVPGAEAGSLMVREGNHYRFQALVGYDAGQLAQVAVSEEEQRQWYGKGEAAWRRGEARILSASEESIASKSLSAAKGEVAEALREAGRLSELKSVLSLPILYRGEVLALLNLDSFTDAGAFAEDSLAAARVFTPPLAFLLHESRYRRLLEEAAHTDVLTKLPNRRAFNLTLAAELARARRHGEALSLLIMDLAGFKRVNDALGHAAGDEALIRVSQALLAAQREGDRLFRWGGDEFAAILPHSTRSSALVIAERHAAAIGGLVLNGLRLGISIGVASYPSDGLAADALLSVADRRMYEAKAAHKPRGSPL